MPHFECIQSISIAGDAAGANDDRAGSGRTTAWVIDGATDLGPPGLMGRQGGAAWLAAAADRAFAAAPPGPLAGTIAGVFGAVADAFGRERVRDPLGRWELPSAAFLAVALDGARLELGWLADCTCLRLRGAAVERLGPQPTAFETEEARVAVAAGLDLAQAVRPAATTEQLRRNRERATRRVLGVEPGHAADVHHAETLVREGDEIVLMTDGMAALIDDYGWSAVRLVEALREEGLHGLSTRLRAIEAEDAGGTRYPRFKRSDDATALWLRVA